MEYTTRCQSCEYEFDQSHPMKDDHAPCPKCKSKRVESIVFGTVAVRQSLDAGWDAENGGRGRYFPQLEQSVTCTKSSKNCFRSRNEAMEACKRRGFVILDK